MATTSLKKISFTKAEPTNFKAKILISGPSGSGKTLSALRIMRGLVGDEGTIAVLDTENDRARMYADRHDFLHAPLVAPRWPLDIVAAIDECVKHSIDGLIIDGLSPVWKDVLGAVDRNILNWATATPDWDAMQDAILTAPIHIIVTAREKMKYEISMSNGKPKPRQVGLEMICRSEIDYNFQLYLKLDGEGNTMNVEIHHGPFSTLEGYVMSKPDENFGRDLARMIEGEIDEELLARYATGATKRSKELFMQEMQGKYGLDGKAIAGLLKDYEGNVDWLNNDSITAFVSFIEEQVNG